MKALAHILHSCTGSRGYTRQNSLEFLELMLSQEVRFPTQNSRRSLGIGDCQLCFSSPQSPVPNPQSPVPCNRVNSVAIALILKLRLKRQRAVHPKR